MGNNNSTHVDTSGNYSGNSVDFLGQFYGKDDQIKSNVDDYYVRARRIYNDLDTGIRDRDIYVEKKIEVFAPRNGIAMPYEKTDSISMQDVLSSDSKRDLFDSERKGNWDELSENPRVIELVVCKDKRNLREAYAVHDKEPDHECKGNCNCIKKYITVNRSMRGGANDDDSDDTDEDIEQEDPFGDSEEATDEAFSTTSEMSPTTSAVETDIVEIKNNNKKKLLNKQNNNNNNNNDDEEDEETEDLEVDDEEDVTEDGVFLYQSDIDSSDLYRMQSRIFGSETDSDAELEGLSETEYTDKVGRAIAQLQKTRRYDNNNATVFDTEEEEILGMGNGDTTDDLMRRPTRKNRKYH